MLPTPIFREVFGSENARRLLLLLVSRGEPVRYSQARDALSMHPQAFQRAMETLEEYALIGFRAPKENGSGKNRVYLEATHTAQFLADLWETWDRAYSRAAQKDDLASAALEGLTGA
jgi:predicted ArsR family transcriptional regulator